MTIFSGSFSLSRYHIIGRSTSLKLSDLNKKLKTYQAKPLQLKSSKELTFAWDRPSILTHEDLSESSHWDMSECQYEDGFMMKIRIEKRKVPSTLLQIVLSRKIDDLSKKLEGKTISRKKRKDLLEEARLELYDQCLPSVSFADVFWHEERDEVFLFSTSKSIQVIFEELFKKTFCEHLNLSIVKVAPPLLGLSTEDWQQSTSSSTLVRVEGTLPSEIISANG